MGSSVEKTLNSPPSVKERSSERLNWKKRGCLNFEQNSRHFNPYRKSDSNGDKLQQIIDDHNLLILNNSSLSHINARNNNNDSNLDLFIVPSRMADTATSWQHDEPLGPHFSNASILDKNPVMWWDSDCNKTVRLRKAAFKKLRHTGLISDWVQYNKQYAF
ncbi:hypothetical protein KPH14_009739 [Odynerus spinipes]|uniref:Uncharacterized protein n=1 Tax=Odynerus spinipes TaxID=1348599 RepID=A0AAD9RGY7_9HYME|nr:hypothetical protein KPH14_009739 [Odynerus spinipes]